MIRVVTANPKRDLLLNEGSIIYIDPYERRPTLIPNLPKELLTIHIDNENTTEPLYLEGLDYRTIPGMILSKKVTLVNSQLDRSKMPTEIVINPQKIFQIEDLNTYRKITFNKKLVHSIYVGDSIDELKDKIDKAS